MSAAGKVSATVAPIASLGPLFPTDRVGRRAAGVDRRLAVGLGDAQVDLGRQGVGVGRAVVGEVALELRRRLVTVAVFTSVPVAPAATVALTV